MLPVDNKGLVWVICLTVVSLAGCGNQTRTRDAAICRSLHENTVLFDKVLIQHYPVWKVDEKTLTSFDPVRKQLGKPAETLQLRNILFSWWRYGNTAYLVADLSASQPGHQYVAAKSCDWRKTERRLRALSGE